MLKYPDTAPLPPPAPQCVNRQHIWRVESGGTFDYNYEVWIPEESVCMCGATKEVDKRHDGSLVTITFEPPLVTKRLMAQPTTGYAGYEIPPILMAGQPMAQPIAPQVIYGPPPPEAPPAFPFLRRPRR